VAFSSSTSTAIRGLGVAIPAVLVFLSACARAYALPIDGIHNIQHVVMIQQENRSFDSYFGTYPGARGIPAATCVPDPANGNCVKPFHDANDVNFGAQHSAANARRDIDGGRMDGFVATLEAGGCGSRRKTCAPCTPTSPEAVPCDDVMGYHDAREIPNYWAYAQNFVLQDEMFEPVSSGSIASHNFLVSGWSAVCPRNNPDPLACVSGIREPHHEEGHSTMDAWTDVTYLLHRANVGWRYFVFDGTEPDCASDEAVSCKPVPQHPTTPSKWNPLPSFTDVQQAGELGNIQSLSNFYADVHQQGSCGLPNVSWITPTHAVSEHPSARISDGQAYVTTLVNAIMRSPCWSSTAIFLSWDDWGGFYDHVPPPQIDRNGYGIRVPGMLISAFAKSGYVDHQQLSFDAYLKFIEDDFLAGARLNPRTDGRPDRRPDVREEASSLGDLSSEFDFMQTPRKPVLLSTHPPPGPPSNPPSPIA
jgi:phospholipase C